MDMSAQQVIAWYFGPQGINPNMFCDASESAMNQAILGCFTTTVHMKYQNLGIAISIIL